ncbi:MAG TPA: hypothetical protein VMC79_00780 [Rectinemataceae bacterium]|nr:hypothetical protein [Rectinemataceae bacterium]
MTFSEKMNDLMNKGLAASREALAKAGAQAQTWGEMGVLKVEILQLRSQAEKVSAQLGAAVYTAFVERSIGEISAEAPEYKGYLKRLSELNASIAEKESRYRRLGGKDSDLEKDGPAN